MKDEPYLIYTTYPDYDTAHNVSSALLQKGIVACTNVFQEVTSIYLWNGSINTSKEHVAIMKTLKKFSVEVQHYIKKNHPYSVPAILSIPMQDCDREFLDWVNKSLKRGNIST